ncbi:MAG: hypothetical protein KDE14_06445 [Rhodobacteraceae bacterium]|nr:hypothetical protein [Paracoccaceae bacterium]
MTADLTATPWAGTGIPPMMALPEGFAVEVVAGPGPPDAKWTGGVAATTARQRLSEGDRCIVVKCAANEIAAEMWCTDQARHIDWIGCDVVPPPALTLLYNAWVAPVHRGHGLQWVLAAAACGDVLARGRRGIYAGVERAEYAPFARKYAAMGLAVIEPTTSLWALTCFGQTFTFKTRPPGSLSDATEKAQDLFARQGRA